MDKIIIITLTIILMHSCAHRDYSKDPGRSYTELKTFNKDHFEYFKNSHLVSVDSGFYPLANHVDSYSMRLIFAKLATKSIKVQYFTFHDDSAGTLLIHHLIEAANRGVKVEILVDDMGFSHASIWPAVLDSHENIQMRSFNPTDSRGPGHYVEIGLYSDSLGRRMHNKSFIIDDSIVIFGGRNIGSSYFGLSKNSFWVDNDILGAGPIVTKISNQFKSYFNSGLSVNFQDFAYTKVNDFKLIEREYTKKFTKEHLQIFAKEVSNRKIVKNLKAKSLSLYIAKDALFYDDPKKIKTEIKDKKYNLNTQLKGKIDPKKSIHLMSPYFIPSVEMINKVREYRKKNIEVKILTNSLESTDGLSVYAFYSKHQKELLELGVKLFEIKPDAFKKEFLSQAYNISKDSPKTALHAKTTIYDSRVTAIGSANMDPRSRNLNTEIIAFILNEELAKTEIKYFDLITHPVNSYELFLDNGEVRWKTLVDGEMKVYENHGNSSWWQRFKAGFLRVLPIRDLL
jgi:putative cardiolipin synthase